MKILTKIEINDVPKNVFSWINDPDKAMLWQKGVKKGSIIKETSQRVGTTFKEELEENGKSLVMYGIISEFIPDKLISFHLESRIHKVDVKYSVMGDNDKSTVSMESIIKWRFPVNVISLFIGKKIKNKILRQTIAEFAELKRLCETDSV